MEIYDKGYRPEINGRVVQSRVGKIENGCCNIRNLIRLRKRFDGRTHADRSLFSSASTIGHGSDKNSKQRVHRRPFVVSLFVCFRSSLQKRGAPESKLKTEITDVRGAMFHG